jgi:hypothetical protein
MLEKDVENSELDQYLASAAAQGLFQGEGDFKIQAEKALEKLSRFALPGPGLWVLKMVQAAVRLGASQIEYTFLRRKVTVEFDNRAGWEAEALLGQLLSATVSEDRACRHLFTGILGAALGFSQEVEWSCGGSCVKVGKLGPVAQAQKPSDKFVFTARRPYRPAFTSGLMTSPIRYLLRQTVQEYKALVDHSFIAPLTIIVDKRPLGASYQTNTSSLPPKPGYDSDKPDGRQAMLAQIPLCGLDRAALSYPIDREPLTKLETPREKFETLRLEPDSGEPVQGIICLYSCLQRQSRLNLVMDGVCLERPLLYDDEALWGLRSALEKDHDDFILDVYLAVSFEDLDVSQFSVKLQSFAEPILSGVPKLCQVLTTLHAECPKPWELSKQPPDRFDSKPVSAAEIVLIGFLSMFIPHAIVLGGVVGTGYVAIKALEATGLGSDWLEQRKQAAHRQKWSALQGRLESVISDLNRL